MQMKLKLWAVILALIVSVFPQNIYAAEPVEIGDYIIAGTYAGNQLLWRCVGKDDNGLLMLSDKIICYKSFDASGEHTPSTQNRINYGSSLWSQSNIRSWLNSNDIAVDYPCGNPPTEENVWLGYNKYDTEPGFLTNFSEDEKQMMKTVTLKTPLSETDASLADGTYRGLYLDNKFNAEELEQTYQNTTDTMFLLDAAQLKMVIDNFTEPYYSADSAALSYNDYSDLETSMATHCFLRIPVAHESDLLYDICSYGHEYSCTWTLAYTSAGIRPAFYLNDSVSFAGGSGTLENPYYVSAEESDKFVNVLSSDSGIEGVYLSFGYASVRSDKTLIEFPDAQPFIDENDRTQVPVRALTEAMGAEVSWNEATQTATITSSDTSVSITIGSDILMANGEEIKMDTAAVIIDERTYVPIRYVAEAMGMTVIWE